MHGAFDDGELPVALHVGQRGAAAREPSSLVAPHLVALGVVDLDRVLVTGTGEEAARTGRDAVGTAGEDGADGGGGIDLLVRRGAADQPAVVVVDPHVAAVGVVGAEAKPLDDAPPETKSSEPVP